MVNSDIQTVFFFLDTCDPSWHRSRDILIIAGFVSSLLPIILVPTVLYIYTSLRRQVLVCCKKCEKVFTISLYHSLIALYMQPPQLSMVGIMIHVITSSRSLPLFCLFFCLFVCLFLELKVRIVGSLGNKARDVQLVGSH